MEYTKRRNLNRGCMTLEVWQRGMDLFDLESKHENDDWRDRALDKILAREPGGAFGVRAYSAALGLARSVAARSITLLKRKAAEYARTPNASRLALQPNEEFSPGTQNSLPHSSNN